MLRAAAKNHDVGAGGRGPGRLPAAAGGARRAPRRQRVRHPRAPGRQGLRAHRALRHHGRRLARGAASRTPARRVSRRRCRSSSRRCRTCATAKIRTSARLSTVTRPRAAPSVASARVLQGKDLSFNNIADADTAIECVRQFARRACVIVKHANPCGAAVARHGARGLRARLPHRSDLRLRRHHRLQPRARCRHRRAPSPSGSSSRCWRRRRVTAEAAQRARRAGRTCACWCSAISQRATAGELEFRSVTGGLLAAGARPADLTESELTVPTRRQPTRGGTRRPALRLARVQVRQVQRHRLRARAAPPSASAPAR